MIYEIGCDLELEMVDRIWEAPIAEVDRMLASMAVPGLATYSEPERRDIAARRVVDDARADRLARLYARGARPWCDACRGTGHVPVDDDPGDVEPCFSCPRAA